MKNQNIEYEYSSEMDILVRTFEGDVTIPEILESWDYIRDNNLIRTGCLGVISDYTSSKIIFEKSEPNLFKEYFDLNLEFFKPLKLAPIIDSPTIAHLFLFIQKYSKVKLKAFSTIKGASIWIHSLE